MKKSLLLLITCIFLLLPGCSEEKAVRLKIEKSSTPQAHAAKVIPQQKLVLALGTMALPKQAYGYYYELVHYLEKKIEMPISIADNKSYNEINRLLKEGKVDVAFICSRPYTDAHDEFGLKLLVAPQIKGTVQYHSYIIVPKDSPINRLEELRNHAFAFSDPLSNSGRLAPTYMIAQEFGISPENFFKKVTYSGNHDNSISMVAAKLVDGAAVDSLIWDYLNEFNPVDTAKTKIIATSPPYGTVPVVIRPNLSPQLESKLAEIFLNIHTDTKGREILKKMRIERFVKVDDVMYNDIRNMKNWLREKNIPF